MPVAHPAGLAEHAHIDVREVHKTYGKTAALRGVSLSVQKNEFVTLLGPSGCGKTTLLRVIGGFENPDCGRVAVGGRFVDETPARGRLTRMVFQQYALFPHMTVAENVAFGLRMHEVARSERDQRVRRVLEAVRLPDKINARPSQLSGGQQQRVALARAIVTDPTVLLLDEPLAALDLQLRKSMQLELKNLQRSLGMTFIYVTHDQSEALAMSDRIAVMSDGRIEQIDTGNAVYSNPVSQFVASFIGEANIIRGRIKESSADELIMEWGSALLSVRRPLGARFSNGDAAEFNVRPEKMQIVSQDTSVTPRLEGKVSQRINLGPMHRLIVDVAGDQKLMIDAMNPGSIGPGDLVMVSWPDEAASWFLNATELSTESGARNISR